MKQSQVVNRIKEVTRTYPHKEHQGDLHTDSLSFPQDKRFIEWYIPKWIRVDDWLGTHSPDIQRRVDLASQIEEWATIFTNNPSTSTMTNITDLNATNTAGFYRLRAQRP